MKNSVKFELKSREKIRKTTFGDIQNIHTAKFVGLVNNERVTESDE